MTEIVKACGKLYLAGEYAVLTAGQGAIIKDIPIYMTGEIAFADAYLLRSDMFEHEVDLTPDPDYGLIQEAVATMNDFLVGQSIVPRPFKFAISGKMEREGKKFGIGSSGSVVILTLRAIAKLYRLDLSQELLFKLASYILVKRGDNGSMGDLACIAYEDLIYYQSFDRRLLADKIKETSLQDLLAQDWGYIIRPISAKLACEFLVGWTKKPAISRDLIVQVKSAITEDFLQQTQAQVERLEQALLQADKEQTKASLGRVGQLLYQLSPAIYSQDLQALTGASEGLDCLAKSSGAGGGDCGIALVFTEKASQNLQKRWQDLGIEILYKEKLADD